MLKVLAGAASTLTLGTLVLAMLTVLHVPGAKDSGPSRAVLAGLHGFMMFGSWSSSHSLKHVLTRIVVFKCGHCWYCYYFRVGFVVGFQLPVV